MRAEMKRHLEAMEMWGYRRMPKVSWTKMMSNEQVLDLAKEERKLMK